MSLSFDFGNLRQSRETRRHAVKGPAVPKLHPLKKDPDSTVRSWCGPTVVATITNRPVELVKQVIWEGRGRPHNGRGRAAISVTFEADLRYALRVLAGYQLRSVVGCLPMAARPTLAAWLRGRSPEARQKTYILHISFGQGGGGIFRNTWERGHWVAVRGNKFVDTFTKGEPVATSKAPHRRKRVVEVFEVVGR